ncbi:guanylate kinase [Polymorphobacter multimanifer]|uniref:Guanylate kinase n=2 Tax=Polymorphobacter multimanifer TaxID=1070431 RepID=A0A841L8F1_9SPHN|nr:guanylate kinase [Polymorphobacter multimanifer]GGI85651.1 guanylate kinase [Polymorphobacter multimanifer]
MTAFATPGSATPARRGLMFVMSSPSGAGKTTLSRRLLREDPGITLSVSATTRPPRHDETDGKDYYFVSPERFQTMVKDHELLEWATVFGNRYGTPRAPVEAALASGSDVLFDIDWQGTQQLQQTDAASDLVRIFILPPDLGELERRLIARDTDHPEVIADRMARACDEIRHWGEYDYVLLNESIETCLAELRAILKAERLRRKRQLGLADFVRAMLGEGG